MRKKKYNKIPSFIIHGVAIIAMSLALGYVIGTFFISKPHTIVKKSESLPAAPAPQATEAEKAAFTQAIQKLAKETTRIEIGKNCTLAPMVVRANERSSVTFANRDFLEHRISIGLQKFSLPAKSEKSIIAQFEYGVGVYGIGCDEKEKGFIEVTPPR